MNRRVVFSSRLLPLLLVLPQLAVTLVFFIWPAWQAMEQSFFIEDAFGFSRTFVGFENYAALRRDPGYLQSFGTTLIFGALVTFFAIAIALVLALAANRAVRGALAYRSLLIWPYAVAPALAGVIWFFLMNPTVGVAAQWYEMLVRSLGAWLAALAPLMPVSVPGVSLGALAEAMRGASWNHYVDGTQAMALVIAASVWKQISYNFVFFLAGLQSIPRSLIEAAAIDHAGPVRRFWTITLPLLSPTTFFLVVVNLVYAFFDTFATIHATTSGGPADATSILVYRVYASGFIGQDYGSSAAQSVILMALVIVLVAIQFRYVERRVVY